MANKRVLFTAALALCLAVFIEPAYSQVTFTEITEDAGLVMSERSLYSTNQAWGDYDGDGFIDVYVTSWGSAVSDARNALYRNNGDGTFTNTAASAGVDLNQNSVCGAWGDFDNDGDLDLFVANFSEGDVVFKNMLVETGAAGFSDVTAAMSFANESIGRSKAAVWGDYNNDGFIDLYVVKYWGRNFLYRNNGGASFTLLSGAFADIHDSEGAAWVDYDDDGDVDLYVINREQENHLYRNDDGEFTAVNIGINDTQFGRFGIWADYDNNGLLDLFLGNIGANSLYQQSAGAVFTEVSAAAHVQSAPSAWDTWGAAWGDYDGDGDLDLFFAGGFDEVAPSADLSFTGTFGNMLLQNANGVFTDRTVAANISRGAIRFSDGQEVGSFASSAAFTDYDNDGDLDLMITNTMRNLFYRNNSPATAYLKIGIDDTRAGCNRNGLGAKIRVYNAAAPGTLVGMREIRSGAEPLAAHFVLLSGNSYTIDITFLKNGIAPPETMTITGVSVPLDTVIVQ